MAEETEQTPEFATGAMPPEDAPAQPGFVVPPATDEEQTPGPTWPTLTPERIEQCKVLSGGRPVYRYDNLGVVMVYMGLKGSEYEKLTKKFRADGADSTPEAEDEQIAAAAVLWPRLPDDWFKKAVAGHAQTLALLVRQQSGFSLVLNDGRIVGKNLTVTEIDPKPAKEQPEPTDEEIQSIRAQAPGQQLFLATFPDGKRSLFTALPRVEWTSINKRLEKDENLDPAVEVSKFCVKWPAQADWDNELAGKINALFDSIMARSGFNVEPVVVEL